MATKKATPAQLAARKKFAEMVRSGAFKKNISNKRKTNSRKKTVSQKISQLTHEQRAGKVKSNPIKGEQHLFGNKYATIRKDADGRFVAQIFEKVKTGIGEEIDFWGVKYYKTQAGAQRYLDSLKPIKNNPTAKTKTRGKVSAVVLMNNPKNKVPKYTVQILKNTKTTWKRIAMFDNLEEAKIYANSIPRAYDVVSVRVIDNK